MFLAENLTPRPAPKLRPPKEGFARVLPFILKYILLFICLLSFKIYDIFENDGSISPMNHSGHDCIYDFIIILTARASRLFRNIFMGYFI